MLDRCLTSVESEMGLHAVLLGSVPTGAASQTWNQDNVDVTHFDLARSVIVGLGGFSLVRAVIKLSDGPRDTQVYAIKQISKEKVSASALSIIGLGIHIDPFHRSC